MVIPRHVITVSRECQRMDEDVVDDAGVVVGAAEAAGAAVTEGAETTSEGAKFRFKEFQMCSIVFEWI